MLISTAPWQLTERQSAFSRAGNDDINSFLAFDLETVGIWPHLALILRIKGSHTEETARFAFIKGSLNCMQIGWQQGSEQRGVLEYAPSIVVGLPLGLAILLSRLYSRSLFNNYSIHVPNLRGSWV